MKIEFDQRHFGKIIRVTADNVRIEEDVEKRTYKHLEGGKLDFSPSRDIEDSAINMFQVRALLRHLLTALLFSSTRSRCGIGFSWLLVCGKF